ncbi:MAG TPA: hypothetical protein PKN27_04415 [Propionibacteriaceae bacterium]|nr:hypothetical protein [Propionibacteriaceae bacterium]
MQLTVTVLTHDAPPAEGTPLVVEVRDTSLMDVAAVTVCHAETSVVAPSADAPESAALGSVIVDAPDDLVAAGALTVFAHVRVAETDFVSVGDFLTVQSYPVQPGVAETAVEVVKIG